jgi:2-dehydro-3-deoxygluconokinase
MTEKQQRAICIGEALIELVRGADGRFALSCGGDAFNTAVYLARAGLDVAFATALGDDPYSASIIALAAAEGISANLILRVRDRLPALALVESGTAGERSLHYWRQGANCSSCRNGCSSPNRSCRRA